MHDAHVHLDFMANGEEVARDAAADGCRLLASTVTPAGYGEARKRFAPFDNVVLGIGYHPWWVGDDYVRVLDDFERQLDSTSLVSEVGLDFAKRRAGTRAIQYEAFSAIASLCAHRGGKVLSVHTVHAAREALDLLGETGVFNTCTCIFHWYSGPSDQLKRAIQAGCFFSVGARMLATGKGREYVKAIPANRILLETDAPPQQGQLYSYGALRAELDSTLLAIAGIKGETAVDAIMSNPQSLFARS